MEEAVEADRIIVMENGNIVMEGTPKEIFSQVDKVKELGLDVPQVTELVYELRKRWSRLKSRYFINRGIGGIAMIMKKRI